MATLGSLTLSADLILIAVGSALLAAALLAAVLGSGISLRHQGPGPLGRR